MVTSAKNDDLKSLNPQELRKGLLLALITKS